MFGVNASYVRPNQSLMRPKHTDIEGVTSARLSLHGAQKNFFALSKKLRAIGSSVSPLTRASPLIFLTGQR